MGIEDLWPFERKFSQIPCSREAGISGITGGVVVGAITYMLTSGHNPRKRGDIIYKSVIYSGFIMFWVGFLGCRHQQNKQKRLTEAFQEALREGKID